MDGGRPLVCRTRAGPYIYINIYVYIYIYIYVYIPDLACQDCFEPGFWVPSLKPFHWAVPRPKTGLFQKQALSVCICICRIIILLECMCIHTSISILYIYIHILYIHTLILGELIKPLMLLQFPDRLQPDFSVGHLARSPLTFPGFVVDISNYWGFISPVRLFHQWYRYNCSEWG